MRRAALAPGERLLVFETSAASTTRLFSLLSSMRRRLLHTRTAVATTFSSAATTSNLTGSRRLRLHGLGEARLRCQWPLPRPQACLLSRINAPRARIHHPTRRCCRSRGPCAVGEDESAACCATVPALRLETVLFDASSPSSRLTPHVRARRRPSGGRAPLRPTTSTANHSPWFWGVHRPRRSSRAPGSPHIHAILIQRRRVHAPPHSARGSSIISRAGNVPHLASCRGDAGDGSLPGRLVLRPRATACSRRASMCGHLRASFYIA